MVTSCLEEYNSSQSCLNSSDTKEDYIAKAFNVCSGEGEKGREGRWPWALDLLWPAAMLDDNCLCGSEEPKL